MHVLVVRSWKLGLFVYCGPPECPNMQRQKSSFFDLRECNLLLLQCNSSSHNPTWLFMLRRPTKSWVLHEFGRSKT